MIYARKTATQKQIKRIESLFIDTRIGINRVLRNAYLANEFGREIRFLDQLNSVEVSRLITRLEGEK